MVILPADVRAALKRQAPKMMRRGLEAEARKKFKDIKAEMQSKSDKELQKLYRAMGI